MISSTFDEPRGIVQFNNTQVEFIDLRIDSSGMYTADLWRVTVPLDGLPTATDVKYFLASPDVQVKIYIGYPKNPNSFNVGDLQFIIQGNSDSIDVDWLNRTITLSGRDFSSFFMDTVVDQAQYINVNATASQIVEAITVEQKLKYVGTPTTIPIGKFFYDSYFFQPTIKTNWDLMTALAQSENYNLYVTGDTLHFEPKPTTSSYTVQYTNTPKPNSTTISLSVTRMMSLTKSVTVNVLSYNQQTKALNTGTAQHTALQGSTTLGRDPVNYKFSIPNLSPTQANAEAETLLGDILSHGMQLNFMSHGDLTLTKDKIIKLTGTNTIADQIYYPRRIVHELSNTAGLLTTVTARNYIGQIRSAS